MEEKLTINASDIDRLKKCNGSVKVPIKRPDNNSETRLEGIQAAKLAYDMFTGVPHVAPNDEMNRHITNYVNIVTEGMDTVEMEVPLELEAKNFILKARPDTVAVRGKTLYVTDLKYGYIPVELHETEVLKCYAALYMRENKLDDTKIDTVKLSIYQPRCYHPDGHYRTETYTRDDIKNWSSQFIEYMNEKFTPDQVIAGSHCQKCQHVLTCKALAQDNYRIFEKVRDDNRRELDGDELGAEIDFLDTAYKMIKTRREAIRAEAVNRLEDGENIAGYMKGTAYGKSKLSVTPEEFMMFTGVDITKQTIMTYAEIEAKLGDRKKLLNQFKESGKPYVKLEKYDSKKIEKLFKPTA